MTEAQAIENSVITLSRCMDHGIMDGFKASEVLHAMYGIGLEAAVAEIVSYRQGE